MYNRGKARLVHMGDYGTTLAEGSYPAAALARIASLEGPADEADFPYLSRRAFTNVGYSVSNPPTHRESEDVGLIPFDYSTPQELYYAKDTVTPRHDLMMTDALYAASRIAPSSFANQREEYARQNSVNRNVLKSLIKTYGAAMICYYADEERGKNFNTEHSAYFDNSNWKANHEITIVGWDDDYPKENFIIQPTTNGAWLARNNWGNFSGSDGGYEWISYEQLIQDGIAFIVKERPEHLRMYEHDPLGWCNSYTFNTKEIWGANVFRVMTSGETLHSMSFYTSFINTQADIFVYDLGTSFDRTNPRDGRLIDSATTKLANSGYHTIQLNSVELTKGHYFYVIVRYVDLNLEDEDYVAVPVEVAVHGYSDNAAVYDGESYISDLGEEWATAHQSSTASAAGYPITSTCALRLSRLRPMMTSCRTQPPKLSRELLPSSSRPTT